MLVLSRKKNEGIVINDDITIVVVEIRGDKLRLGIESPKDVPIHRREVFDAIHRSRTADYPVSTPAQAPSPRPTAYPAQVTLSSRHVELLDRLRDAIREKSGLAPCRDQTVEAIFNGLGRLENTLTTAKSLGDLQALLAEPQAQSDTLLRVNGHSGAVDRLVGATIT